LGTFLSKKQKIFLFGAKLGPFPASGEASVESHETKVGSAGRSPGFSRNPFWLLIAACSISAYTGPHE
jgi:hypothetical protein